MKSYPRNVLTVLSVLVFITINFKVQGQQKSLLQKSGLVENQGLSSSKIKFVTGKDGDLFGKEKSFIENIGQYGDSLSNAFNMGKTLFGYEGLDMPVLFTSKGLIHIHRKVIAPSHEERERMERQKIPVEEINKKTTVIDKYITLEWVGANPNVQITSEDSTQAYHTYGMLQIKARSFKKITYHDLYPGIDVIYFFKEGNVAGFEYSLIIHPGADLNQVQLKYGGDVKTIKKGLKGKLIISSGINSITETQPQSFYENVSPTGGVEKIIVGVIETSKAGNIISFHSAKTIDATKTLIIDPFVSNTNNLTGFNQGKAKDIDFDFGGNVYVSGGWTTYYTQFLAKYDANGNLIWTFNGYMNTPYWYFNGGWVVEKFSGTIYLTEGTNPWGIQIVRLNSNGFYNNYITNGNPGFNEGWKMIGNFNNGNVEIYTAGGSTQGPFNLEKVSPPNQNLSPINLTGITKTYCQDITDVVIDPITKDMYCIFTSLQETPIIDNRVYKFNYPYSSSSISWFTYSGYKNIHETNNRPYNGAELIILVIH